MNSPERIEEVKKVPLVFLLLRCYIAFLFVIFIVLVVFTVVVFAAFITNIPISYPFYVPCRCKIVSSSVDIRSAEVCELGLLNYKAKHVFYPYEKKKFRCRYDYYWASVFEALPHDCRPTFSDAWMAKDNFKVNGTYDCWYSLGFSKLNLFSDEYFNCQADHPSTREMLQRYLSLQVAKSSSAPSLLRTGVPWEQTTNFFKGIVSNTSPLSSFQVH